ncbi:MAG TPA: TIGR00341 family protein [Armatimonadota bacterium]|nr:TIGR00341 family protein [Armatimonadota bacterium]
MSELSKTERFRETVREQIHAAATLTPAFAWMNGLSTVVACYGLLENSTPVVIGAMVIATLLGPITGLALALVDADHALLRRSVLAELAGAGIVLGVALIIGLISRDIPFGSEILGRTSPNLMDLLIALAGGAAGAYAVVSPRVGVGVVGVAIATALVPPLSICGLSLARGDLRLGIGGFLLFFTNLVAIQFSSSVVLALQGFHRITMINAEGDRRKWATRIASSFVLLLILTTLLTFNLQRSVSKLRFETSARQALITALNKVPGAHLVDLRFLRTENRMVVTAVVRAPNSFPPPRVQVLEHGIPPAGSLPVELHVRAVLTKETTRHGYLYEEPASSPDVRAASQQPDAETLSQLGG